MTEEWKGIKGYENKYQISNLGRVRSLDRIDSRGERRKGKILKGRRNKYGYMKVALYDKIPKEKFIHRLVAEAFIDNPCNHPIINHKDEDKSNNNVLNLEWCSCSYNVSYGTSRIRSSQNTNYEAKVKNTNYKSIGIKNREHRKKIVYQYSDELCLVKIWSSVLECETAGFSKHSVSKCCRGILKKHKGYIWSYKLLEEC